MWGRIACPLRLASTVLLLRFGWSAVTCRVESNLAPSCSSLTPPPLLLRVSAAAPHASTGPNRADHEYALAGKPLRDTDMLLSFREATLVQFYEGAVDMAHALGVAAAPVAAAGVVGACGAPCPRFDAAHVSGGGVRSALDVPLFEKDVLLMPGVLGDLGAPSVGAVQSALEAFLGAANAYEPGQGHPEIEARNTKGKKAAAAAVRERALFVCEYSEGRGLSCSRLPPPTDSFL